MSFNGYPRFLDRNLTEIQPSFLDAVLQVSEDGPDESSHFFPRMQSVVDRPKQRNNFITVVHERIRVHHVSYMVQEGDISMLSVIINTWFVFQEILTPSTYQGVLEELMSQKQTVCPFESWLESDNYDIQDELLGVLHRGVTGVCPALTPRCTLCCVASPDFRKIDGHCKSL